MATNQNEVRNIEELLKRMTGDQIVVQLFDTGAQIAWFELVSLKSVVNNQYAHGGIVMEQYNREGLKEYLGSISTDSS